MIPTRIDRPPAHGRSTAPRRTPIGARTSARHRAAARSAATVAPVHLPTLAELGHDLLTTSTARRIGVVVRPCLCVALYAFFAMRGEWPLAALSVVALFITIVASAHDLVHRSLGLPAWANEILLMFVAMLVLESGHAYKVSHLNHHRRFPLDDDPEGDPARMTFPRALLEGPIFLFRLWGWALLRAPRERAWLLLEAGWFFTFVIAAIALWPRVPALLVYTGLVIVGSWAYPVATVYLQHDVRAQNPLLQTRTLRGRIVPALFLELTYHLEHHLYPATPSHQYAELSRRLEPHLRAAGVEPTRVW